MVKVYTSLLLTIALVAGSALAFSDDEYQRRSEVDSNWYSRELVDDQGTPLRREDLEELYGRFGILKLVKTGIKIGVKIAKNKHVRHIAKGVLHELVSREFEDDEELFGRDLDAEVLFGREYDHLDEREIFDDLD